MVSSDTWVGIVGAVVLTGALVGVFLYEAGAPGPATVLSGYEHPVEAQAGPEAFTAAQQPPDCVPQAIPCAPARYSLSITVQHLPELRGGELHYAAFLVKPNAEVFASTLTKSGQRYELEFQSQQDHRDATAIRITLETSSSPARPGLSLFTMPKSGGSYSFGGNITLAPQTDQALRISTGGAVTKVAGTLQDLPVHAGLQYRAWLVTEDDAGTHFTLLANLTAPEGAGASFNATLDAEAMGVHDRLVVSLERTGSTQTAVSGYPVYDLALRD